jgi:Ca-activated chloride channel family protein
MIACRHLPLYIVSTLALGTLVVGSVRDPDFWITADQRGDRLLKQRRFAEAAKAYHDPMKAGIALYRGGSFEQAARTFTKVPGEDALFNAGNSWLMHGQYQQAIERYDLVLKKRAGWKPAADNKAIAAARLARMDASGKDRDKEATEAYSPDEITVDNKGGDSKDPQKPVTGPADDASLQATWLRRVKTTPAQFLKAKFAWQASQAQPVK